jgi:hypothetical protein
MNLFISNYTSRAGVSADPTYDADYTNLHVVIKSLHNAEKAYIDLNKEVTQTLKHMSNTGDIQNQLREVGSIQQKIIQSKKELEEAASDADTSLTRQYAIERPREELSWYQGFSGKIGFTKPLRHTSVAFMIGLGLLLLFLSALMLKEFFSVSQGPIPSMQGATGGFGDIFSVFTDARFISILMGMAIALVVILVLTIRGYLGKNLR